MVQFPNNELELSNGTVLKAMVDMPQVNLKAGQMFVIYWDGQCVRGCGLAWLMDSLVEEINVGYWQLAY